MWLVPRREVDISLLRFVDVSDDVDVSATFGCLFVVSGKSGEWAVSTVTRDQPLYAPVLDGKSWNNGIEKTALQETFLLLLQLRTTS